MAKVKTQFVCQNCGYSSPRFLGRCPNCGAWNQMVEEREQPAAAAKSNFTISGRATEPEKISTVNIQKEPRVKTELNELNRVLGGGVVPGSLILIGGDPGIGKSTLLLQVSGQLEKVGKILYVSGEESASQIKMRANRLGVNGDQLYLYPETDMGNIRHQIETLKPEYVVIDSI